MTKRERNLFLLSTLMLPIVPMLYLYNNNYQYLSLAQIGIVIIVLLILMIGLYALCNLRFKSEFTSFVFVLVNVILIFAYNRIYNEIHNKIRNPYFLLLAIPLVSYLFILILNKLLRKASVEKLPHFIFFTLSIMLIINIFPIVTRIIFETRNTHTIEYKEDFVVDDELPSPNVYWILCDGLLGFEAMGNYFNDSQEELISTLSSLGFEINKSAMLESGHKTRVAVPALMCPEFYDKYLVNFLSNHETAMDFCESNDNVLSEARFNNEFITAFDESGYTTITMSLDEDVFFPTTDYYYYLAAHYTSNAEYEKLPYYVEKSDISNIDYFENRFFASQLGNLFLGGIPTLVFDNYCSDELLKHPLTTSFHGASDILLNSEIGNKYSALINSTYDALYSEEINEPKLVIIHDFMAHYPFMLDENGNLNDNFSSKESYLGHHTYATKVLVSVIDMILNADPDAVIVLQSDHGLHGYTAEDIVNIFGTYDASLEIWNNVFSCVRVPEKYKNGEEKYMMVTPLNISRYLVNNFVGENYSYIEMES